MVFKKTWLWGGTMKKGTKIMVSYTEEYESIKEMELEIKSADKNIVYLVEKKQALIDGIEKAKKTLGWTK